LALISRKRERKEKGHQRQIQCAFRAYNTYRVESVKTFQISSWKAVYGGRIAPHALSKWCGGV